MNIILDTSTLQEQMSGTGYYTLGMLQELLNMKSVDTVQTLGGSEKLLTKLDNGKITAHFTGEKSWHRLLNITMAANRPNIRGDAAIFPNYFIPPAFPIPSLATIHDLSFFSHPHFYSLKMRAFYRQRIKHTFSSASRILTVSNASKEEILSHSKRPEDQIISIHPGPSLPRDYAPHIQAGFPYFLLNGNIEPRKNVNTVLRAFLEANLNDHHLVIAGKQFCGGRYWREFIRLVGQSDRILYLGYIDNHELKRWYTGAQGGICCSFVEGFGIPIANTRSMGQPCLISDHPALEEAAGSRAIKVSPHVQTDISRGFKELATLASENQNKTSLYTREHDIHWQQFSFQLEAVLEETALNVRHSNVFTFNKPQLSSLKESIINTMAYSAIFGAPIRIKKCFLELQNVKCSYNQMQQALQELNSDYPGIIIREGNYIGLKSYTKSIDRYRRAVTENSRFIAKHKSLLQLIDKLPWISGIYFSGGTVHASHLDKQDLDLFIIAKANRIWPVYTLLKLLSFLTHSRNLLCFNYLIDTDNLRVKSQQDLYTAHQILHLKPALNNHSQPDLKAVNRWIYNYFPNSEPVTVVEDLEQTFKAKKRKRQNWIMEIINLLLMTVWGWHWKRNKIKNRTGGIRWDAHQIKLHTNDHRPWVYNRFSSIQADIRRRLDESTVATSKKF